MTPRACSREDEVLTAALALRGTHPPEAIGAHLASCDACRGLYELVATLQDERALALSTARVPSAGQVWWRATIRARHEDAARAAQPITVVAALTLACVAGVLASLTGLLAWWLQDHVAAPATLRAVVATWPADGWTASSSVRLAAWFAAGAMLIATPVLLYVALRDE